MDLSSFSPVLLLCISLTAGLAGNIMQSLYGRNHLKSTYDNFRFTFWVSAFTAIILFILLDDIGSISLYTFLLGIAFGFVSTLQTYSVIIAVSIGPISYTSMFASLSSIIPTLSGAIFWNESIGISQYIGIALMLGSIVLSRETDDGNKKKSARWFFFCIETFIATGLIGVLQKTHQSSAHKSELGAFLLTAFVASAIFSLIMCFVYKKERRKSTKKTTLIVFSILAIEGLASALFNSINLHLSGVMESAVFYPIVNVGGLILCTIAAVILFKDKLSKTRWIGLSLGILSVFAFCI